MTVVINDFEVIPDDPERDDQENPRPESAPDRGETASLRPHDVLEIVEAEDRRRRRLRAH